MRRITTLCVAATALMLPASALAETLDQTGQIVDDDATKVTLGVELSAGTPLQVLDFKAKRVFTRCDGEPDRLNFTSLDPIRVDLDGTFKTRLTDNAGGFLRIAGKVKDGGQATVGTLKTNEIKSTGGRTCKTPKQKFKTFAEN